MPFPWSIKVNGQSAHTANANRISALIPKPGEVEHWILKNGGGGWDHPIHLHFEEGQFLSRTSARPVEMPSASMTDELPSMAAGSSRQWRKCAADEPLRHVHHNPLDLRAMTVSVSPFALFLGDKLR
jgi:FtsP/CotA-like multicopper oxidase with cupredoxin domain